jgi:hypothetical protein
MMKWQFRLAVMILSGLMAGCTSIKSTFVERKPYGCGWDTRHLRGVPITVKVPTHLEVKVKETHYMSVRDGKETLILLPGGKRLATRSVEVNTRLKDEVFTVDFVKPAAGMADTKTSYHNQYFKKITGAVKDETIQDITNAFSGIVRKVGALPGGVKLTAGDLNKARIRAHEATIAVQLFEVHDPLLEEKIRGFVSPYVTDCFPPCNPGHAPGLIEARPKPGLEE